jgi:hypothetical protein
LIAEFLSKTETIFIHSRNCGKTFAVTACRRCHTCGILCSISFPADFSAAQSVHLLQQGVFRIFHGSLHAGIEHLRCYRHKAIIVVDNNG